MANFSDKLLDAATVAGPGGARAPRRNERTFQAIGATTAGAGAAAVDIEASNDGVNWVVIGTITLVLTVTASNDGFASDAAWRFVRANLTSISGTGASITVWMGA